MKTIATSLLLFLAGISLYAQTFYGTGGAIPDNGTPVDFIITVDALNHPSIDTTYGLESVCLNIIHTWDADLDIALIAPDGTYVDLVSGHGGGDDNFVNTCFNSNAGEHILHVWAPFTGTFHPTGDLGAVNNGQSGTGQWKLHILDTYAWADQGSLINWSLNFGDEPSLPFPFDSSDLPIMVIDTYGQPIPDEPKIMAHLGIIDNGPGQRNHLGDPFNDYDGWMGIERRGSSSQSFPKKSYGFETRDSEGLQIDTSLLGMPKESDWILNAHYSDKTLMRNVMTYHLSRQMGHWAARTRYCEVVINGQYWGVYAFMEKIKRDNHRVDIKKLAPEDTTGIELTGGYILKIDKSTGGTGAGWQSPFPPPVHPQNQVIYFQYEYPEYEELQPQQIEYIQSYVDTFETALYDFSYYPTNDYREYIDMDSFVDFFILNELSRNVDGYRLSAFFFKDRGGKLVMGPLWDFDIAWHNADYCEGWNSQGWAYEFGNYCPGDYWQIPFWWQRLLTDPVFTGKLRCRWDDLRNGLLSTDSVMQYIQDVADTLDEGQERNFVQWPILGWYVWPNPYPLPQTYSEEISTLKQWVFLRLVWLDNNIPGECNTAIPGDGDDRQPLRVFPSPARDYLRISAPVEYKGLLKIELLNSLGQPVREVRTNDPVPGPSGTNEWTVPTAGLADGVYMLRFTTGDGVFSRKVIIAGR
jgi:subtilisin-like proprotein convertase family protein